MTGANGVLWRRLRYMLTPQFDIYTNLRKVLSVPSVLEVGFGTGFGVLQYASGVWDRVDAIEIEQEAVDFAKSALPVSNVNWMLGDILMWQANRRYAAVVMIEVLEHISAWDIALRNVRELLLPDGIFVLSHRNAHAELRKNDLHEREWTALEMEVHLAKHFQDVKLWDYSLDNILDSKTRQTPLIAIARR